MTTISELYAKDKRDGLVLERLFNPILKLYVYFKLVCLILFHLVAIAYWTVY